MIEYSGPPWIVVSDGEGIDVRGDDGHWIAHVGIADYPENQANARLIAAAPDLLAACEAALDAAGAASAPIANQLRAAIEKAGAR